MTLGAILAELTKLGAQPAGDLGEACPVLAIIIDRA